MRKALPAAAAGKVSPPTSPEHDDGDVNMSDEVKLEEWPVKNESSSSEEVDE